MVANPADGSRWLNGQGYFDWRQQTPADRAPSDLERRELWYMCTGYLIRADEARSFLEWAEGVDFWGRWMPDAAEVYEMFLGEHAWAPASRYFQKQYYGDDGWTQPDHGCPVRIRAIAFEYLRERGGLDCSIDESYGLRLPISEVVSGAGIRWSGHGGDFVEVADRVAAMDPTVHANGPSALLLREDLLRAFLTRAKLTMCWAILGEKRVLSAGFGDGPYHPAVHVSGAYVLGEKGPVGFVRRFVDDPGASASAARLLGVVRSGT